MANASPVPVFPTRPSTGDFFRGFALPFRAIGLLLQSRRLFGWAALSGIVTLFALIAAIWGAIDLAPWIVSKVFARPIDWPTLGLWYALVLLTFALLVVVGVNTLPALVLAPLQDPISEATELLCGNYTSPPSNLRRTLSGVFVSVSHTLARILILLAGHAVLFPLNLIPGAGSAVWGVLSALWTMVWLAAEYLDAPMARHFYRFGEVRQVLWRRKALAVGFGAAVWLLLWLPILNFFFIPLAIVGGTLLFRGLCDAGALRGPRERKAVGDVPFST
ncbi:MAG: EI24 domain-containing protein [Myxococcaceae bacterium]